MEELQKGLNGERLSQNGNHEHEDNQRGALEGFVHDGATSRYEHAIAGLFEAERARIDYSQDNRAHYEEWRGCKSKKRYGTKQEAQDAIFACAEHGTDGLSCYRCEICKGWHLTSHPWKHE